MFYVLYFDGACSGNPGPSALGYVVLRGKAVIKKGAKCLGWATNNQAEYAALIAGLKAARELGIKDLHVRGDSKLVIDQLSGQARVKHKAIKKLYLTAKRLLEDFHRVSFEHVPRAKNRKANRLARKALRACKKEGQHV